MVLLNGSAAAEKCDYEDDDSDDYEYCRSRLETRIHEVRVVVVDGEDERSCR